MMLKVAFYSIFFICFSIDAKAQSKIITIDDSLLLSGIDLQIHDDKMLIYDGFQSRIFLLDKETGSLIREIHSDPIHPGFHWAPISPYMLDDAIFVVNSIPWGFYIGYENEFLEELDMHFEATSSLSFIDDETMAALYINRDYTGEVRIMDRMGYVISSFRIDLKFPVLDYRSDSKFIIPYLDNFIIGSSNQKTFFIVDATGRILEEQSINSDFFLEPTRDKRKTDDVSQIIHEVMAVKNGTSTIWHVSLISKDELLVYIYHENKLELLLQNINTGDSFSTILGYRETGHLTLAQNGKLYFAWLEEEKNYIEIKTISEVFPSYSR